MRSLLETIMLLKRVHYFELLRTDQLRHIVPLLEETGWVAGERVFEKGDLSPEMFIIVQGMVGVSVSDDPNDKEFVTLLGDGDCFGEMGILDDAPRSATIHVLKDTQAWSLGKEKLHGLLLSYPEFGIGMLKALSRRLREAGNAPPSSAGDASED